MREITPNLKKSRRVNHWGTVKMLERFVMSDKYAYVLLFYDILWTPSLFEWKSLGINSQLGQEVHSSGIYTAALPRPSYSRESTSTTPNKNSFSIILEDPSGEHIYRVAKYKFKRWTVDVECWS